MIHTFSYRFFQRLFASYCGYRWLWHVLAALVTLLLVLSGFDWWFFEHTRAAWLEPLILLAGIGGFFVPVAVPVILYAFGKKREAILAGQAALIGYLISTFYKIFTGRTQPEFLTHFNTADISRDFHFGFFEHGIFWGWPSSHAAVAVAAATALYFAWPNRTVRIATGIWAAVVCVGAAVGFHWFSDVAAGMIIGALAGFAVHQDDKMHLWRQ